MNEEHVITCIAPSGYNAEKEEHHANSNVNFIGCKKDSELKELLESKAIIAPELGPHIMLLRNFLS